MSAVDFERRSVFGCMLLLLLLQTYPVSAKEVWLMTYGTGDLIEERFGHNALWVRDPARGIDAIYNFGFFDFDQPGFYQNYLFGRMMYYAVARDPADELGYYQWRDREVLAQRLNLSDDQIDRLSNWLEVQVSPENRNFRYDYYFNNCSNRIRDALDHALDGGLRSQTESVPAEQNLREHTRRLIQDSPLLYLGIHAGLGRSVDQPRTIWEAMFLPEVVARQIREVNNPLVGEAGEPMVLEERILHASDRSEPAAEPQTSWFLFGLMGLITAALVLLPTVFFGPSAISLLPFRLWLLTSALAGAVLLFLWFFTEHQAAWRNENLLLLNPLILGLWRARFGGLANTCAGLVAAGLLLSVLLKFFDGAQWNYDLMLWWLPAQIAVLYTWYRSSCSRTEAHIKSANRSQS